MENISAAARRRVGLSLINIEAGDRKFLLAIEQGERQSDVAETDDSDLGLAGVNAAL